jgi:hypothetical protein
MEQEKCAPNKQFSEESCFDLSVLKIIAEKYNKKFNDKINSNLPKLELVKELEKRLNTNKCNNQTCWLKSEFLKELKKTDIEVYDEIYNNTFRPLGPTQQFGWLSNVNIDQIIQQYHDKHEDFLFLGSVPYDFEEIDQLGLKDIDFDELYKDGKYKLGLVINLDTHDKSGSHWVALFINLKKYQLYYFDSFGIKPGKRVRKFNNKVFKFFAKKKKLNIHPNHFFFKNKQIDKNKKIDKNNQIDKNKNDVMKHFDIRFNQIQHQVKNSECGVYSTNFILRLIKDELFDEITENITRDDAMNECRSTYFRNV